jgi:hypothetical protein
LIAGPASGQDRPAPPRAPKGIYVTLHLQDVAGNAETAAYPSGSPAYPNPAADAILVQYFIALLNDPAVSGLAPQIPWKYLNPNDPGPDPLRPAAGAYVWNPLDDLFIAVDRWNRAHSGLQPKNVQVILSPGFNSPGWVFSNIDSSVCGSTAGSSCNGSCDGLFAGASPGTVPAQCGYTSFFFQTESGSPAQQPLPMGWNPVYEYDWHRYLGALNQRIQQEPGSNNFVSVTIAGPTASSAEMILPNIENQAPLTCNSQLSLMETLDKNGNPVCPLTNPGFDVPTAWNLLFQNHYGTGLFQNTDLPFIGEWDAEIAAFSGIFHGITLELVTTTDALPDFTHPEPWVYQPARGFEPECGNDPQQNSSPNLNEAMQCAAVTQVLAFFTSPLVGGNNAKLIFEAGMTASRTPIDLDTNGIKWLTTYSASGLPLPGTFLPVSPILGGLQFDTTFSEPRNIEFQGCPDYSLRNQDACGALTAPEGLANVLAINYFPGTAVGPFFCPYTTDSGTYTCAPTSVDYNGSTYTDAPMNFVEIYDPDILYAAGLGNCTTLQITGNPVAGVAPSCVLDTSSDVQTSEQELELASKKLLSIAETPRLW